MNKFILLAIVAASVALASCNPIGQLDEEVSELALSPDDDTEIFKLKGTNVEGFRDFCYRTRDYVVSDMKSRGNMFASDVFGQIFRSLGEIAQTSVDANTRATERLAKQLANPNTPIGESNDDQVDQIIADGQRAIQEAGSQPQGVIAAFVGGVKSFAAAGYSDAVNRIMKLKESLGSLSVAEKLIGFCTELSNYEAKAIEIFEETKAELMTENADQYKDVKFSDVAPKCITSNRLSRAEGLCKFVLSAKEPLAKVLNFRLPGNKSLQ